MLRLTSVCGALVAIGLAAPAIAADRSVAPMYKAPPAAPAAVYQWTGFYIGAHAGGVWDREQATTSFTTAFAPAGTVASADHSDFLAGGQIGLNYQMNNIVVGVEGDGSWTEAKTSSTIVSPFVPAVSITGSTKTNWFATATARLGYAAGPVLLYVKGGGAWENIEYSLGVTGPALLGLPLNFTNSSVTRTGWTVGGGIEYGFMQNWSVKAEYDYMDFGDDNITFAVPAALGNPASTAQSQVHVVKAGINYRFGWGGPVVARY
jgi:outer membrane immunogenic protein